MDDASMSRESDMSALADDSLSETLNGSQTRTGTVGPLATTSQALARTSQNLLSTWETTHSGQASPIPAERKCDEEGMAFPSKSTGSGATEGSIAPRLHSAGSLAKSGSAKTLNFGDVREICGERERQRETERLQSAETEKYQAMIMSFDRMFPGLKQEQDRLAEEKAKQVSDEEIDELLGEMLGTPEQVAVAATRLKEIVTGDDAGSSALRIKLMATPMAIDSICQGIISAEEIWTVIYNYGVSVRAQSNQKSARIGNISLGEDFAVSSVNSGWLKLKRSPHGHQEGWVRIGPVGKEQVMRQSQKDDGKIAAMHLLVELSQLRHLCLELPRKPQLVSTLAFLSTIAPAGSPLREASTMLLTHLRVSRTVLNGWPSAPGRRVANDRSMHTGSHVQAPELHALRTAKMRRPPTPSGPSGVGHHEAGETSESALVTHSRMLSSQSEGWYGTGIHPIIAPPPVTSLRAYTSGIRLPVANLERRSKNPGGPLHVASHVSTFDWTD